MRLKVAVALAVLALSSAPAWSQGLQSICVARTGPNGENYCQPVSPANPFPVTGGGGGGGGSSTITSPVGSNTKAQSVSVTYATDQLLPAFNATPTFNLGTLNGAALDTSVQAVKTALGSPFQAGGSIGNTGFNAFQSGSATSLTNPFFVQLSQGGAALSGTNPLPTGDVNVGQTIKAPGTSASYVIGIQGVAGGVAMPISGAVSQTGGPWTTNQTQLAGTALGAPTAYGTAPTGNVPGVNANVTASALPTGAATGAAQTNVQSAPGTAQTTALTVQGNNSGIPLPVSGSVTSIPSTGATLTTSQPSVTTTAAALTFSGTVHREIYNPAASTASIFIGASGVTTSTGWEVPPGSSYDVSRFSGSVFAIAASSQTVRLISY